MSLYPHLAATSLRLLKKYGQPVVLRRYSQGGSDYNPSTGRAAPKGANGSNDMTRFAVPTDAPGKRVGQQYGATIEANSLIQDTDRWMYMDANGPKPTQQDHIIYQQTNFSIIDVQEINPGGIPLLYLIVIRA